MKNNEKNGRKSVCLHKKMLTTEKSYATMKSIHDTYHEDAREIHQRGIGYDNDGCTQTQGAQQKPRASPRGQLAAVRPASDTGGYHYRVQVRTHVRYSDCFPQLQPGPWHYRKPMGWLEMV